MSLTAAQIGFLFDLTRGNKTVNGKQYEMARRLEKMGFVTLAAIPTPGLRVHRDYRRGYVADVAITEMGRKMFAEIGVK